MHLVNPLETSKACSLGCGETAFRRPFDGMFAVVDRKGLSNARARTVSSDGDVFRQKAGRYHPLHNILHPTLYLFD